jgi:hypothetical protein
MRRLAFLLAAVMLAVTAVAACGTPMDEAGARKAATAFFLAMPHEGGAVPQDVVITDTTVTTRDGRGGWDVAINGQIILPGLPQGYLSAMILFVDGSTGQAKVVAKG